MKNKNEKVCRGENLRQFLGKNVKNKKTAIFFAILAAALYAVNVPLSKLLQKEIEPTMLAGLLYLGAGMGMGALMLVKHGLSAQGIKIKSDGPLLEKRDIPYTVAMVVLDIAAPILLMFGIANTGSANVSLLNNFEIVATSAVAFLVFREKISPKLFAAILLVVAGSIVLGFEGSEGFVFNRGSVFVLLACLAWGIENNCTKSISDKSSEEIVLIKGLCSGAGSVVTAFILRETLPSLIYILAALLLGFIAYGISIKLYIMAQSALGAAKTSAFYSVAPFLGVGFGFLLLGERPGLEFYIGMALMVLATVIMIFDTLDKSKR